MTEFIYLTDSYLKDLKTKVVSVVQKGKVWEIVLEKTIFYPQGGGQLSDQGEIVGPHGKATVKHVRMHESDAVHECSIDGLIKAGDEVECVLDWDWRYLNMRRHSGGHIVHEAVMQLAPSLKPLRADHGKQLFIEYEGSLPIDKTFEIERKANEIVSQDLPLKTEIVSYDELVKRVTHIAGTLPKNKPLRILSVGDFAPMPDGGTQVKNASEVGPISVTKIENVDDHVRVYYTIEQSSLATPDQEKFSHPLSGPSFIAELLEAQNAALREIETSELRADELKLQLFGPKSEFSALTKQIRLVPEADRQQVGIVVNQVKQTIESTLQRVTSNQSRVTSSEGWFDVTMPGVRPPVGHLHIVTQAIMEITRIFERIGFSRVRHPEVDWDWYAFGSLNMPPNHPARDEWETFFIDSGNLKKDSRNPRHQKIVLTPHTSNGQVREMEKGKLPIRMINIAKCYRRQIDVSHTPMFHQFEGLYVDHNVSIAHLKGVLDYFVKQFFGPERKARIRPFHFQFTEPSFEVDINCGICLGTGKLKNGDVCRLCKSGWLELGGAGMVHPVVLRNGGVDPEKYSGFAFGWGIERTYMMKAGTQLDDIRLLYSNDVRFLEQF